MAEFCLFNNYTSAVPDSLDPSCSNNVHPVTKQEAHYVLYDKFHQGNTKREYEILRRIQFVPELNGYMNTQSAEQRPALLAKKHFLDAMSPSRHITLSKAILLYSNYLLNKSHKLCVEND